MMERFSGISGAKSKAWRKLVAGAASSFSNPKNKTFTKSIKFPLEIDQAIDFDRIKNNFDITSGTHRTSLFGLLMSVHLSGFRIFPSAHQAICQQTFPLLEREFSKAWRSKTNIAPGFSPTRFTHFLTQTRRGNVKKDFSFDTVKKKFLEDIGASASTLDSDDPAAILLDKYLQKLTKTYSSWDQLNDSSENALVSFDKLATKSPIKLPAVSGCLTRQKATLPPNSTISFDSNLLRYSGKEWSDINLHKVVTQQLIDARNASESISAENIKLRITTEKANGLSWLLNVGFLHWRQTNVKGILSQYKIPKNAEAPVKALKKLFDSIPENTVFSSTNHGEFRTSVQGKVDSWISNYLSQLFKIEDSLKLIEKWSLPSAMGEKTSERYFRSIGETYEDISKALIHIHELKGAATTALDVLLGKSNRLPNEKDIGLFENISEQISYLSGGLNSISNAIKQDLKSNEQDLVLQAEKCRFDIPNWLRKELPRVNRISGGAPDVEKEIEELEQNFRQAIKLKELFTKQIIKAVDSNLAPELSHFAAREEELLIKNPIEKTNPIRQAKRKVLHRLTRIAISGSDGFKLIVSNELKESFFVTQSERDFSLNIPKNKRPKTFEVVKNINRLIYSEQGDPFYLSPLSTSKRVPIELNTSQLDKCSPMKILEKIHKQLSSALKIDPEFSAYRDLIRLEDLIDNVTLSRLPARIATHSVPLQDVNECFDLPNYLTPLLASDSVARETVWKLRALITSHLSGVLAKSFRQSFFVRAQFSRNNVNNLTWTVKGNRQWNPPKQVESSERALGKIVKKIRLATQTSSGPLDSNKIAGAAMSGLTTAAQRGSEVAIAMSQMPHDWYMDLGFFDEAYCESTVAGYDVSKAKIAVKPHNLTSPARLIGSTANKTLLDQTLINPDLSIGDYNLLFEKHFEQEIILDKNLIPTIKVRGKSVSGEISIPFTEKVVKNTASHPLGKTVIGIDLGEVGVGYAVFSAKAIQEQSVGQSIQPITSGTIPVRSVRNLIKKVNTFRKKTQPKQRFRQGASTALATLREGALGDVCFVIDALCAKHSGFPVLETSIVNLASGGKQLKLIYDKIVHTYWFSKVDAHAKARYHHWAGGKTWKHPFLTQLQSVENSDGELTTTGKREPLTLHPGHAIYPAGTSQTCSMCERNPISSVYDSVADNGETTFTFVDSRVELASGDKLLFLSATDLTKTEKENALNRKIYRRRKERMPSRYAIGQDKINQKDLDKLIRKNIRHGQKSLRSKDTTQSVYSCVFDDCGHTMHADENAAINIVRKWVGDKEIH